MTDLPLTKIVHGTDTYEIKDATARSSLANKQDTLVSGTNIKTINNESILGSGNIIIEGGSGDAVWGSITGILGDQTDLGEALHGLANFIDTKQNIINSDNKLSASYVSGLATVATTGDYIDLINKPNAFTGADGVNAGVSGLVPAPTATDNDKYLKGDGTWATVSGGGSVTTDNVTINTNIGGAIQTVGVINKNTNATAPNNVLKFWHGSETEYDNATTQDFYGWENQPSGDTSWQEVPPAEVLDVGELRCGMAAGGGKYIILGYMNKIFVSTDITTGVWSEETISSSDIHFQAICHTDLGNNTHQWVILGHSDDSMTGYALYSNDNGVTWNEEQLPASSVSGGYAHQWTKIIYFNGIYIAIPDDSYYGGTDEILIGTPQNWSYDNIPNEYEDNPGSYYDIKGLAAGNGKIIICLNNTNNEYVYANVSNPITTPITWNVTTPEGMSYPIPENLMFGNGIFIGTTAISNQRIAFSSDGLDWNDRFVMDETKTYIGTTGIFGGDQFILGIENEGNIACSNSPAYFRTEQFNQNMTQAYMGCYGNGKFVFYSGGNIYYKNIEKFQSYYFTTSDSPTTSSTVYTMPKLESPLTITASVADTSITLSNGTTYERNSNMDGEESYSVGELYPDYICIIDNYGVKYGNKTIASFAPKGFTGTFTDMNYITYQVVNGIIAGPIA